jgi:outer membrane protein assembly factor BamB
MSSRLAETRALAGRRRRGRDGGARRRIPFVLGCAARRRIPTVLGWRALGILLLALALPALAAEPEPWSRFRGPNGSGAVESTGLPLRLEAASRLWRAPIPPGFSSPVLDQERAYLTGLEDETLVTLALDRETGATLWRREAPRPRREKLDRRNHPAAASPVTDGERVFVFFADFGLLAYTSDGEPLWQEPLGPFDNVYGMGASPVLVGDLLVMLVDQSTGSYLLALDTATGARRWRSERPGARSGHATPIVYRPEAGDEQILVAGSFRLTSYAAGDGRPLWWADGLSFEIKSTPVILGDTLYVNRRMRPYVGFCGTGAEMRALSATDVALWDIAAKDAGKPLCDLLGGCTRDRIRVYNTCARPTAA